MNGLNHVESDESSREPAAPTFKLFAPAHAGLAAFLGGPFAGALVMAVNLYRLRQPGQSLLILCFGTFALMVLGRLRNLEAGTMLIICFADLIVFYALSKAVFGKAFDSFIEEGGIAASKWAVIGIGLGGGILGIILIIAIPLLFQLFWSTLLGKLA